MAGVNSKSFDTPDVTRTPDKTKVEVLRLPGSSVARITFQPGWRWSDCIKPVAGTDSCKMRHVGTLISGQLHIRHDDGTDVDIQPGAAYLIEPGHDGWVVGDEPVVSFEFESQSAEEYATG